MHNIFLPHANVVTKYIYTCDKYLLNLYYVLSSGYVIYIAESETNKDPYMELSLTNGGDRPLISNAKKI